MLVINADRHKNVIDALRSGGVKALEGEQLYKATQSLWVGTEEEFRDSKLAEWFREERAVAEESKSEYDVHLVRVDLPADDVGLHRDVNQVDRADAFRRIQSMKDVRVTVSDRLPSDAYGTTGVYKR
ncbi:MAG: hypothetical protein D6729_04765 [Deltaproteobacteria bacterium]|nr:MAG: hypothetical protein D6729_04765 [Deltaproteobacteria bacterium]